MRLTGGEGKGRRLKSAPDGTRPTSARARELLFQVLADRVPQAKVLDLFAGCGTLGLESLARGASHAIFIEAAGASVRVVKQNIALCGFEGKSRVVRADVFRFVSKDNNVSDSAELIFADPPYAFDQHQLDNLLNELRKRSWVTRDTLLVLETSSRKEFSFPTAWERFDHRVAGDTAFHLLRIVPEIIAQGREDRP